MSTNKIKRFVKRNSHNSVFSALAGFGRSLNRFYENHNFDTESNGERNVIEKISQINPDIIFDVGANTGKYTTLLDKFCPYSRIFSFEPIPETFEVLKDNCQKFSNPNISLYNYGLGQSDGNIVFNLYKSNTHASLYKIKGTTNNPVNEINVTIKRGDEFLISNNISKINFLKIDAEGSEMEILKGFIDSFSKGKIDAVQFEYGYINITTHYLLVDFYDFFKKHDFIVGKIFPKTVDFKEYSIKMENFIGSNYFAVRKDQKKLIELLQNNKTRLSK